MIDLGTVRPGSKVRIPFSSFDKDDGSAVTMTNYAAADILVYKDGNTTERASTSGFVATTDFDGKTGKHIAEIDLADNTTSGHFTAGSEYLVAIDVVTIDSVNTGGWIGRFVIGYPDAWLNTTIATLSSQTSFTLTNGAAEDNAYVGHYAIIHDIASAVQSSRVLITAYTGASKTVTLAAGATFTAAAGDNISIMGMAPMQPATIGRNPVVDAAGLVDANTVKVGPSGSGTAQTAGDIMADTNDIQTRLPAALVGGRIDASVGAMANNTITAAAAAADFGTEVGTAVWATATRELTALDEDNTAIDLNATAVGSVAGTVGSVTGNVGGNVVGSVASVTGNVGGSVASVTGNLGGNVTGSVGSLAAQAKTDVHDQVVAAIATDTFAEPGQGAPAATLSLAAKINYLFKAWRNKYTQTATTFSLFADDATTVDQKATVSDDGTTLTRSEIATGP